MILTADSLVSLLSLSAAGHSLTQHLSLGLAQQGCQRCQRQDPQTAPLVPANNIGLAREESPALI